MRSLKLTVLIAGIIVAGAARGQVIDFNFSGVFVSSDLPNMISAGDTFAVEFQIDNPNLESSYTNYDPPDGGAWFSGVFSSIKIAIDSATIGAVSVESRSQGPWTTVDLIDTTVPTYPIPTDNLWCVLWPYYESHNELGLPGYSLTELSALIRMDQDTFQTTINQPSSMTIGEVFANVRNFHFPDSTLTLTYGSSGQVVGNVTAANVSIVPEPSCSAALAGCCALAGVVWLRRRRVC